MKLRFLAILLTTLLAGSLFFNLDRIMMPQTEPRPLKGIQVPILMENQVLVQQKAINTGDLAGPMVMHWWASWCAACKEDLPKIMELFAQTRKMSVAPTFVAVATSDRQNDASTAAAAWNFPYLVLFDSEDRLARDFGVVGIPHLCVFDRQKVSRYCWQGSLSVGNMRQIRMAIESF